MQIKLHEQMTILWFYFTSSGTRKSGICCKKFACTILEPINYFDGNVLGKLMMLFLRMFLYVFDDMFSFFFSVLCVGFNMWVALARLVDLRLII